MLSLKIRPFKHVRHHKWSLVIGNDRQQSSAIINGPQRSTAIVTSYAKHQMQNIKSNVWNEYDETSNHFAISCVVTRWEQRDRYRLTLFSVRNPTTIGATIPAAVPPVFVIPMSTPASAGAMSMWFMHGPELQEPREPVATAKIATAATGEQPTYPTVIKSSETGKNATRQKRGVNDMKRWEYRRGRTHREQGSIQKRGYGPVRTIPDSLTR